MKIVYLALTAAVLLQPGQALAMGLCDKDRHETASISCADGLTWDAESQKCVEATG